MFVLSKLLSAITQPVCWLALWWAISLLVLTRWRRPAVIMLWSGLAVLGLLGFQAIPDALLRPLENRYPVLAAESMDRYAGIIVLGGATGDPGSFDVHGQVPLGEAAERMSVSVALMRRHPNLDLVFSGGEGRLLTTGVPESKLARAFYKEQGLDMDRVRLEEGSRNTRENAELVARMLGKQCDARWLLLTSAWHMPRAMAEFEAAGCNVTAYPVDFRTGRSTPLTEYSLAHSLLRWQTAMHEWLGLWVYGVTR